MNIDEKITELSHSITTLENKKAEVISSVVTTGLDNTISTKETCITWAPRIPAHWNVMPNKYIMRKIKNICAVHNGEDIISLSMNGVIVRDLDAGGKMPTTFDGYQFVYPGNLLMCLFDYDVTPRCIGFIKNYGITSPAYSQFEMLNGNIAEYYYYYYLMVDNTKKLLHLAKNLRHSFSEEEFGRIFAIVPPIEEQIAIAEYLTKKCAEIDDVIADIKAQIETLQKMKQSVVSEVMTRGLVTDVELRDSGIEWIGLIPAHWQILKVKDGFFIKKSKALQEDPVVLSLARSGVKIRDISTNEGQLAASYYEYNPVAVDDLLINPMDLQSGANCSISKVEGVISPAYVNLRYKEGFNPQFFDYYFKLQYWSFAFFSYGKGVSFDNRWTLNTDTLMRYPIIVPPIEEQIAIAEYLTKKCAEIDDVIADKEEQLDVLESYKKSLIYEIVTGKRGV